MVVKKEIIFDLINDLGSILENISVEVMDKTKMINPINISPKETKIITLDFSNIPKTDGHYEINFNQNGEQVSDEFGYITNGIPSEDKSELIIPIDKIIYFSTMKITH